MRANQKAFFVAFMGILILLTIMLTSRTFWDTSKTVIWNSDNVQVVSSNNGWFAVGSSREVLREDYKSHLLTSRYQLPGSVISSIQFANDLILGTATNDGGVEFSVLTGDGVARSFVHRSLGTFQVSPNGFKFLGACSSTIVGLDGRNLITVQRHRSTLRITKFISLPNQLGTTKDLAWTIYQDQLFFEDVFRNEIYHFNCSSDKFETSIKEDSKFHLASSLVRFIAANDSYVLINHSGLSRLIDLRSGRQSSLLTPEFGDQMASFVDGDQIALLTGQQLRSWRLSGRSITAESSSRLCGRDVGIGDPVTTSVAGKTLWFIGAIRPDSSYVCGLSTVDQTWTFSKVNNLRTKY